ncbi:heavy metal translocating P-type ATPase [Terrisporobacter sp.]|uniref:heavy metal translocating P-type ATPase n=2 Tax=Terrisporobacter TaxID=1505652 RepID=UPI00289DC656|nr:heavy metal translocating P-type ATPase [Terrisporobacter sp.]
MLTAVLTKKELMLNGLTCAHCAETIGEAVKNINGIESSNMNFISKKLTLEIDSSYNEETIISEVISLIDSIEPGLDIQVLDKKVGPGNKKELMLNGLTCAHCAEVIGDKVKSLEGIQSSNLNFVNKKLTLELNSRKNEDKIIEDVIGLIDSIEPGLDIQVIGNKNKSYIKKDIILGGLNCAHCAEVIGNKVSLLNGVKSSNMNFVNKKLSVEIDNTNENITIKNIINIINDTEPGLDIQIEGTKENEKAKKESKVIRDNNRLELLKILLGAFVFIFAFYEEMMGVESKYSILIFLVSYILVGGDVVYKALRNMTKGRIFDENFLMTVATVGAIAIGDSSEAVGVMLFYKVGEYLQELAVGKSRKSISDLMQIKPDVANLKVGNSIKVVDPEEVEIGDFIIVKPGEKVPLDGVVIDGNSMVDTSALTGESVLRTVKSGDELLSGFINKNSLLTVKVTKSFSESTVSKILDLVENASSKKSKTENFISVFSKYYTPIVVILATLIAVVPPIFVPGAMFSDWLHRGLVFLVVSCPCALVLSIPLSYFSGIGVASRNGILIKGSNYLEALRYVDTVVFDKTGTLTEGVFDVVKVKPFGISEEELIKYASIAEANSNHPIAKSILNYYSKEINLNKIEVYEEIAAHGIKVKYENEEILAGNEKLMTANDIKVNKNKEIGTVVYIAVNNQFKGYIVISDKIKSDSEKAIKEIKAQGIKETVMLTGDNKEVADSVAKQLKVDKVYSNLLPNEKVEKIESIYEGRSDKEKIAFVGDGINDAPVLARVDVGIAMGGLGSDAAIEAADIVIMTDEPSKIAEGIKISKKTYKIVWQNIIFALGIKIVVMVFGALGMASMWEAVFADVGVALIAVLNAMRIMK